MCLVAGTSCLVVVFKGKLKGQPPIWGVSPQNAQYPYGRVEGVVLVLDDQWFGKPFVLFIKYFEDKESLCFIGLEARGWCERAFQHLYYFKSV